MLNRRYGYVSNYAPWFCVSQVVWTQQPCKVEHFPWKIKNAEFTFFTCAKILCLLLSTLSQKAVIPRQILRFFHNCRWPQLSWIFRERKHNLSPSIFEIFQLEGWTHLAHKLCWFSKRSKVIKLSMAMQVLKFLVSP